MKKTNASIVTAIIIVISGNLLGQVQKWDMMSLSIQPYNQVILHDLTSETLYVKSSGNILAINIDSINYLKREKPSLGAVGVIFGMTIGGIIGYDQSIRRSEYYHGFKVLVGMLAGGVAGLIAGEAVGGDEYYFLRSKSHEEKVKQLETLIARNKNKGNKLCLIYGFHMIPNPVNLY